jgi:trehalose 6-phosphate synthase
MKITVRLVFAVLIIAALAAGLFTYLQVLKERELLLEDLNARASVLGESMREAAGEYVEASFHSKLVRMVNRFGTRDRLIGIAVFDSQGVCLAASPRLDPALPMIRLRVRESIGNDRTVTAIDTIAGKPSHLFIIPLDEDSVIRGALVLTHDLSFIDARVADVWRTSFLRSLVQVLLLIITIIIVVRWSITRPIQKVAQWMRG